MGDAGRHRRNIVSMASADLFIKALGVALFYTMSHRLSGPELAAYALFLALFPVAAVAMGLGLPDVITRELAKKGLVRQLNLLRRAFAMQCAAAAALLAGVAAAWAWGTMDVAVPVTVAWAGGFIWAGISLQHAVFAAHEDFRYMSAVNAAVRAVITLGSLALLYGGFGLYALFGLMIPMYGVQMVLLFAIQRRLAGTPSFDPEPVSTAFLLREGSSMLFGRLAATGFYRTGMPVLAALAMPGLSQVYGQGFRFWVLLTTLPDTLESLFLPIMSRRAAMDEEAQRFALVRFLKYMLIAALPAAAGATVLAPHLTLALFGPDWAASAPALTALTWVMAFTMADRPAVVYLRAQGAQRAVLRCYGAALVLKVGLALYVTPRFGLMGLLGVELALSVLLTCAVWGSVRGVLPSLRFSELAGACWKPAMAAAAMAALLWPIRNEALYFTLPAGIAIYGAALLLVRGFDAFDWRMMRGGAATPPV